MLTGKLWVSLLGMEELWKETRVKAWGASGTTVEAGSADCSLSPVEKSPQGGRKRVVSVPCWCLWKGETTSRAGRGRRRGIIDRTWVILRRWMFLSTLVSCFQSSLA